MVTNRILELRKKKQISQLKLAQDLGITRQTVHAIEKNKYNPSLELALRIAKYFNKQVEEIFWLKEDQR
ncbi:MULTISPECIES: helix-turn-helix transcriptional regulator [Thermoactinomyces]|uniref:Helix-turn-helix transcriptional regulator n=1 Tax=Thermoactinomyces daqus TaxID=1329516 RepID=A0A7W1X9G5_9BACL|nr:MULTISPECIES: helix-turn-helix transcriptional regulator [Thermoactinomyces]MBA4542598.1 helix-turn-helix transcriptional regulator [Thermoactinomyces daqus]MBH8598003.1 helix-turn-helix transcriptional regulator [Thermoactinomyces sp. CICC 10523]MBH8603034.1 helix-turn-helix transcriptional regulator [Thermoactinomyces sp. CICC 10522]MBH8609251.1 helix-turn-helix transcriptional regulator [Thermoactinomyces sp. CICC 10521]